MNSIMKTDKREIPEYDPGVHSSPMPLALPVFGAP
jgi:hypothetical protein